jgi:glycosyltransferase involved in cell wall biosynthesis
MSSILFFGFYDPASPRTWTLKREYEKEGFKILECHTTKKGFFRKCADLIRQYRKLKKEVDEVLVLFPGHHLMPLAWTLTLFSKKKLSFADRKLVAKWSPKSWFYWFVDFVSCHLADEVLIDTKTHREYFIKKFKLHPKRVRVVYLEAITDIFKPNPNPNPNPHPHFEIFFYGSFIPLQGIDVILRAAKILESDPNLRFTILGGGQTEPEMKKLAGELSLKNVTFKPFAPMKELPRSINNSDLCLGIFGVSEKTQRVIPHKVLDYLACGKKVVTARTPGILEIYENDERVILCNAGDAEDLAMKIKSTAQLQS